MGKGKTLQQLISLANLDEFEETRLINSPKSLEACKREGIEPEELLYIPLEAFAQPHLSEQLQQLHHQFFEAKRKGILEMVKRTRANLLEEQGEIFQKSSSTRSLKQHQAMFGSVVEHAKEKHLKMMSKLLSYECSAAAKLQERQALDAKKAKKEAKLAKIKIKQERELAEQRRLAELDSLSRAREEENLAKRETLKRYQKELEETLQRQRAEEAEAKARAKRRFENEERRQKHLQKMEENLAAMQSARERKLMSKLAGEDERQRRLEDRKEKTKSKLKSLSQLREEKKAKVFDNIETIIEHKRGQFEQRQEQLYKKHLRFIEDKAMSIARIRHISSERDEKIAKTRESADLILEEKRKLIIQKAEEDDRKVEKQRDLQQESLEFKKHEEMLRGLKKEWNVRRKRKKDEYFNSLIRDKMKEEENRIKRFLQDRDSMIKQRQDFNTQHMMQKHEIKQALTKMAITKKWDADFLKSIGQEERSVNTATTQMSRHQFHSNRNSSRNRNSLPSIEAPPQRLSSPLL